MLRTPVKLHNLGIDSTVPDSVLITNTNIITSLFLSFLYSGKASVIIALTDGELNEQPLIAAQQEVKSLPSIYVTFSHVLLRFIGTLL